MSAEERNTPETQFVGLVKQVDEIAKAISLSGLKKRLEKFSKMAAQCNLREYLDRLNQIAPFYEGILKYLRELTSSQSGRTFISSKDAKLKQVIDFLNTEKAIFYEKRV